MERDIQLDCYRSLTMMYIVCIIHSLYFFYIDCEFTKSIALFEMPVIFFIAGAAQSYKENHYFLTTLYNRIKRLLIPYYIFIVFLFIFYYIFTISNTDFEDTPIDIFTLNKYDIIKILVTGGSEKIPYLGYTWFISCYFIIACSLPIQNVIIRKIPAILYIAINITLFALCNILNIHSFEDIVDKLLFYNIFYVAGYTYYKKISIKNIVATGLIPLIISLYLVSSGTIIPMQPHKYPPDILYLIYCMSALCVLGFIFSKVNIQYNYIVRLWNTRGYTIYLYQSISHFIVYKLTCTWREYINNEIVFCAMLSIIIFITATALSYITFPAEKYIMKRVFKL